VLLWTLLVEALTYEGKGGEVSNRNNAILAPHWQHDSRIEEAHRLIDLAIKLYEPRAVYSLYSSGNDSACSTAIASEHKAFSGAATIDTTIGIPEALKHGRATAKARGWAITTLTPPITYEEFCERFGMPGPGAHALVYSWLKERCVRNLVRPHIRKNRRRKRDRVLLITGVRLAESDRRMGHVEPIHREGSKIWLAPLINWSATDCLNFRLDKKIAGNPVKPILGISGECLCGAFARPGEMNNLRVSFPDTSKKIEGCQERARLAGRPCVYGERPMRRLAMCQQCERKGIAETEAPTTT
jgi:3'-phosphoadenosine 5'-phosphosulfate sulfotransferase (PAPS reductase)/FAD synthetase